MRTVALVLVALALWTFAPAPEPAVGAGTKIFPLSIKGKSYQPLLLFGFKAPPGKINDKAIAGVLQGTLADFADDYVDLDPGGKYYLYWDTREQWRIGTNPNGQNLSTMVGAAGSDGLFWFAGDYDIPMVGGVGKGFAVGKVKYVKGTDDPAKISGTFYFVSGSDGITTALTLKFKTVGPSLI